MSETSALRTRWLSFFAVMATASIVTAGSTPAGLDGPATSGASVNHVRIQIVLESSIPADGDTVRLGLESTTLVFSGSVESKLSSVRWIGPAGDTVSLRVSGDPDRPEVITTEAPPGENGPQILVWRSVSVDGHQVAGEISFVMAAPEFVVPAPAEIVAGPNDSTVTRNAGQEAPDSAVMREFQTSRIVARGLGMFCLLGFAGLLWFGMGTMILDEPQPHRLASILGLGATLLLAVDLLLWTSNLRLPGIGLSETLGAVIGTRSGAVEIWRAGFAAAAFLLFTGTGLVRAGGVFAFGAVVIGALGGHQAAIQPLISLPVNGLHLGAAAIWTGGLLLIAVWPMKAGGADLSRSGWTFQRIVRRVSSAALLASGVILLTAIIQDVLYLPSLGAMFSSGYGKLVLTKSAGFAALVSFGAYNRIRLIPALEASKSGERPLRKSVRLEVIVVIVTVLVAVVLSQAPPPLG